MATPPDFKALARMVIEILELPPGPLTRELRIEAVLNDTFTAGIVEGRNRANREAMLGRRVRLLADRTTGHWSEAERTGVIAKVCLDGYFGIDGIPFGVDDDQLYYCKREEFEIVPETNGE